MIIYRILRIFRSYSYRQEVLLPFVEGSHIEHYVVVLHNDIAQIPCVLRSITGPEYRYVASLVSVIANLSSFPQQLLKLHIESERFPYLKDEIGL